MLVSHLKKSFLIPQVSMGLVSERCGQAAADTEPDQCRARRDPSARVVVPVFLFPSSLLPFPVCIQSCHMAHRSFTPASVLGPFSKLTFLSPQSRHMALKSFSVPLRLVPLLFLLPSHAIWLTRRSQRKRCTPPQAAPCPRTLSRCATGCSTSPLQKCTKVSV